MDKERKAIIKNSDMTEDMQQDAINVATKAIDSYNIEKDIACYIIKKNLIENIILLGIVLLEEILEVMLLMKLNILFIFILDKLLFYFLNLGKFKYILYRLLLFSVNVEILFFF